MTPEERVAKITKVFPEWRSRAIEKRMSQAICEAVAEERERSEKYRAFARRLVEVAWGSDEVDGSEIQEWGTELGILEPKIMTKSCATEDTLCGCDEFGDFPTTCYRWVGDA